MEAKIIKVDGTEITVQPKNGQFFELKELQNIVGGYIEPTAHNGKTVMIANEEGKLNKLPINRKATLLAEKYLHYGDFIVGDVIIVPIGMYR